MSNAFRSIESSDDDGSAESLSKFSTFGMDGAGDNEDQDLGMFILNDQHCSPSDTDAVDIVAVHGLFGHYQNTWKPPNSAEFWLKDFLSKLLAKPSDGQRPIKSRVLSFGYDASLLFKTSNVDVEQAARQLIAKIHSKRPTDALKARPIVFIAHSLGGIVVKQVSCQYLRRVALTITSV